MQLAKDAQSHLGQHIPEAESGEGRMKGMVEASSAMMMSQLKSSQSDERGRGLPWNMPSGLEVD